MGKRSYHQFCPLALALDVIGERWTLLIVRELLAGPKRFTDLMDGLPGIGSNLLSKRLKEMETYELIAKSHLPPPAASTVYEMTPLGLSLEPLVAAIAQWGVWVMTFKPEEKETLHFKAAWAMLGMKHGYNEELAREMSGSYQLEVGSEVLHVVVADGVVEPRLGPAEDPVLTASMDLDTYKALVLMESTIEELIETGLVLIEGPLEEALRFYELFLPALTPTLEAATRGGGGGTG
jgi:DNA-binding HxlR family transcriptional regulator